MKQLGVKGKIGFFGTVILIGMLAVYSLHTYRQRMLQMRRLSEATASMLAEQVMADREYYTSVVVPRAIDGGMKVSKSYHDIANAIPLPATFVREVSEKIEKGGNYSLRLISLYPINSSNAPKGRFEKEALEFLLKSAEKTYSRFEEYEGRYSIRYMIPDLALKTCVDCHNNHPSSAKKDYKVGDTMGGLEVIVSMEKEKAVAMADVWRSVGYGFIFILGTCVAGVLLANRIIISPLVQITRAAEKLAIGELNAGVSIRSRDEIGELGKGMNEAVKGMRGIILKTKELSANVDTAVERIAEAVISIKKGSEGQTLAMTDVSASSEGLHKTAMDIARGMEHLTKLSFEISSSILEMSASVEEVDGNVADLTVAVGDVYGSIEEIAGSLKEVAVGIDNISRGADETASSLVEIDASAKEIESHAMESVKLSNEVAGEGEKGVKVVELTHAGMEKIKASVNSLAAVIDELGRRSKEIGKIVNVIDDVAMETNLLALNATILAAQAGEHGKGFNVVADEIRELSERTAASTREITGIVSGIQGQIEKAVASVEDGMAKVVEGERLSIETTLVLKGITGRFKVFQSMSLEIARATKEQASGSKQVTQNIEGITNTIHQIARATQEQSQGAGQIVKAVEKMRELAAQIKKATAEQAQGSKIIASNTENVTKGIEEINAAASRQEGENQRISAAVIETTSSAAGGIENARMLEEMASMLKKEMDKLKQGLEKFKLD